MKFEKLLQNLEKNNMMALYAETKEEACEIALSLLKEGDTVSLGGSESVKACGLLPHLRSGKYQFLDRGVEGLTREEIEEIYRKTFFADAFFSSCNAVTEDGVLYNVDGNANRVAAICYGPKSVVMIVGKNKIVKDCDEAVMRVKTLAAPKNCTRLSCDTPCKATGHCAFPEADINGCNSDSRICCQYLFSGRQRIKDRIKVIIVNEDLGF